MRLSPQLIASLRPWLNAALSFLYPETCQLCREARATPAQGFVCAGCRAKVRFVEPPFCQRCGRPFEGALTTQFECGSCLQTESHFRFARSAVIARHQALEVIHRYKYNRELWFEPFLADLLVCRAKPELATEHWDGLIPIPLHPSKERVREFNQAERLARCLGSATGIPVNTSLLRRVVPTPSQTLLTREERLANVRNAFAMRNDRCLNGERLMLIDDVFTTGATASSCARVLRAAGAGDVCVWTLARGS